jgi:hypothetical protein
MNPTSEHSYRRFPLLGRSALGLLGSALVLATVLSVVASTPGGADAGSSAISWSIVSSPTTPPTENNYLVGVSCTSSAFCAAVGTQNEIWNGSTWSIVPGTPAGIQITGVSCTSPSACMAVGNGGSESWNGSTWSEVAIGFAGNSSTLNAVSCTGPSACTGVGSFAPYISCGTFPPCGQPYQLTLIESWNGSVWSIVPSPNAPYDLADYLTGVSCSGPSACIAVGEADGPLIESWNGSVWSIVPSPNTPDNQPNYLNGVSCTSAVSCTAVGVDVVDELEDQTLIESWNGSVWSIVPSPNTSSIQNNTLNCASCIGPSACTAVGTYYPYDPNQSPVALTLIESWNGSVWSIIPSPNPSPTERNSLGGISCTGSSACTAVGLLAPPGYTVTAQPFIESSRSIPNGRAPVMSSDARTDFTAGSSGTFTVTSRGRPLAFVSESGPLPSGVSFIDNGDGTATLSGVPVAGSAGTYPLVITASNGVSPDATQNFTLTVENPPTTSILIPSNGTALSGATYLDASASNASRVTFRLFGGSFGFNAPVICRATPTVYGWLCGWNTTRVPDGSYVLVSEAFNSTGSAFSAGVSITVDN